MSFDERPIIDWLLEHGRFLPDTNALVRGLGERLLEAGLPLWRLRLSMRTLHPLTTAVTSIWERDTDKAVYFEAAHGLEGRAGYVGSPLETIARTQKPFRKKLDAGLEPSDHNILHDLKARGGTDYLAHPVQLSESRSAAVIVTTDARGGFHDLDIDKLVRIVKILAPIVEVFGLKNVSRAVAGAYLGTRTGERVLQGQITRGDIELIDAAILISDIRGWTSLNDRLAPIDAVGLANRYFDMMASAIDDHGGEILKFLGDGLLAIFPTVPDGADDRAVCNQAHQAAVAAIQAAADLDPPLGAAFGIGIHFGTVIYGNVGSKTRIDFTVTGQAVNKAARIEDLCGRLGHPILYSSEVADRLDQESAMMVDVDLKGIAQKTQIFRTKAHP